MSRFLWTKMDDIGPSPRARNGMRSTDLMGLSPILCCTLPSTAPWSRTRLDATRHFLLILGVVMLVASHVGIATAATAGVKPKVVPSILGRTCNDAKAELRALDFALQSCPVGRATNHVPPGTINYQSIAAGAPIYELHGLRVTLEPPREAEPPPPTLTPPPLLAQRPLPDLRGMTCQQAASALAALAFRSFQCQVGAAVDGYSAGRINRQSRPAGTPLPINGSLVLTLQPSDVLGVPNVVEMTEPEALSLLAERGFKAAPYGPAASAGRRVLSQNPSAGVRVPLGTSVGVRLGLTVPDLSGLSCADARSLAGRYGHVEVQCDTRPSDSAGQPVDQVFQQSPRASDQAFPGQIALRVVVWAAQPVTVPDVRAQKLEAAVGVLKQAELVARPDATGGDRDVTTQDPVPGAIVNRGSMVQLTTSPMGEVPDVVKLKLADARRALTKARFRSDADAADHSENRVVSDQAPSAGSRIRLGNMVKLSTMQLAPVTNLVGRTCAEATSMASRDGFVAACDAEQSWRERVFGAPRVQSQAPAVGSVEPVGSTIQVSAVVPLPKWLV